MIMSTVGRGGEGDVGQRIRDEILVIQVEVIYCLYFSFPSVNSNIDLCLYTYWSNMNYILVDIREIMTARAQ